LKIRKNEDLLALPSICVARGKLQRHVCPVMGSALFVLLGGCTPADPTYHPSVAWVSKPASTGAADHARVSDAAAVQGCDYLGEVVFEGYASRGSPPWWAEQQVRELAAARGATDVVLESGRPSTGKAYRCSFVGPVGTSVSEDARNVDASTDAAALQGKPGA
jgi:hypothetical protein